MANTTDYLKKQYAAQQQAALAELKSAYDTNISKLDEEAAAIPQQYETARNEMAAQNAIARKNFNEQAAATGLNTGTSGQAELARSSVYQRNLASANVAEQNAQKALDRDRLSLQAQYENAIAATKAENDAALNNALYQEMLRRQNYGGGSGGDDKKGDNPYGDDDAFATDPMANDYYHQLGMSIRKTIGTRGVEAAIDVLEKNVPYLTKTQFDVLAGRLEGWAETVKPGRMTV